MSSRRCCRLSYKTSACHSMYCTSSVFVQPGTPTKILLNSVFPVSADARIVTIVVCFHLLKSTMLRRGHPYTMKQEAAERRRTLQTTKSSPYYLLFEYNPKFSYTQRLLCVLMCFVSGVLRFLQTTRGTLSPVAAKICSSGSSANGVACFTSGHCLLNQCMTQPLNG